MKTLNIDTGMSELICVGTYESTLEIDTSMLEYDIEVLVDNDLLDLNDVSDVWHSIEYHHKDHQSDIMDTAVDFINVEILSELELPFNIRKIERKSCEFHSPKEYNFTTDIMSFDLVLPNDWMNRAKKDLNGEFAEFAKFIRETFGSRDGFSSFMPMVGSMNAFEYFNYVKSNYQEDMFLCMYLKYKGQNLVDDIQDMFNMEWLNNMGSNSYNHYTVQDEKFNEATDKARELGLW